MTPLTRAQDTKDDVTAGVKSTALLFGDNTKVLFLGLSWRTTGQILGRSRTQQHCVKTNTCRVPCLLPYRQTLLLTPPTTGTARHDHHQLVLLPATQAILTCFAAAAALGFGTAGFAAGVGWPYYAATCGAAAHMAWQIRSVDLANGADCMDKFVSNKYVGGLLFAGALAGRALA
jgi:4-hydroxybenzoate polyprenyltransferase